MPTSKGCAAYEKHVAAQPFPKRYKAWARLTEAQQAEWTPKPVKKSAKKSTKEKKS